MSFPDFAWAVGEESSDPIVLRQGHPHRVDELALSRHLDRQDHDLADVAGLGVRVVRYGMPWRLAEPAPGAYDWSLWDRALVACERHGLEPVVDLCHFGLPDHLPGFCEPTWIEPFLRYVDAFLARYRQVRWFTPVNEPLTTAAFSGRHGIWNDRRRSDEDFARALALCTLANLEAHARIVADRDGWSIGAEALAIPGPSSPDRTDPDRTDPDRTDPDRTDPDRTDPDRTDKVRRALDRAAWDLPFGRALDPLAEPAFAAVPDAVRARIDALATTDHVIAGHDLYPISVEGDDLTVAGRLDAYERWAGAWHARYQVPFWVAETSNLGLALEDQVPWLDALTTRLAALRAAGLPVRGLCWYSRGDQFDWQTALVEPTGAVTEVGLFTHGRAARPVAARFAALVDAGAPAGTVA